MYLPSLGVLLGLCVTSSALAHGGHGSHQHSRSFSRVEFAGKHTKASVYVDPNTLADDLRSKLDLNRDGDVARDELSSGLAVVGAWFGANFRVYRGFRPCRGQLMSVEIAGAPPLAVASLEFACKGTGPPRVSVAILADLLPDTEHLLTVAAAEFPTVSATLTNGAHQWSAEPYSASGLFLGYALAGARTTLGASVPLAVALYFGLIAVLARGRRRARNLIAIAVALTSILWALLDPGRTQSLALASVAFCALAFSTQRRVDELHFVILPLVGLASVVPGRALADLGWIGDQVVVSVSGWFVGLVLTFSLCALAANRIADAAVDARSPNPAVNFAVSLLTFVLLLATLGVGPRSNLLLFLPYAFVVGALRFSRYSRRSIVRSGAVAVALCAALVLVLEVPW